MSWSKIFIPTLLILFATLSPETQAQTAIVKGRVMAGGEPVAFAHVTAEITGLGTATDTEGRFELKLDAQHPVALLVSCVGYRRMRLELTPVQGINMIKDIEIQESEHLLQTVVVSATGSEIAQYKAPVLVSAISGKMFESTQSLSLSEGLNFTPGLRLETNCQNCGFTQVRMNGLEGSYSQILINSRPVFSALAGVYGLEMLPASMIDRVEVVRGGGSVLHGGNAIAGTINIITKEPYANLFEASVNQAFVGISAPDRTINLTGAMVSDDVDRGIHFYAFSRDREPWDANADGYSEMVLLRNRTFGFDCHTNPTPRSKAKLGFYTTEEYRRGGNKFHLLPHQADVAEQLDHRIMGLHTSYEHADTELKHKWSVYGSAQWVARDSYYGVGGRVMALSDSLSAADLLALNAYGIATDQSLAAGMQYIFTGGPRLSVVTGAEYNHNDVTDRMEGYGRQVDQRVTTLAAYSQLQWTPAEQFTLVTGGRMNQIDIGAHYQIAPEIFDDELILRVPVPRASAMWRMGKNWTARTSYSQGYRAPQAFDEDLHIETVGGAARFVRLDPELTTERSTGTTASLTYARTTDQLQLSLVLEGFNTRLKNPFILADPTELPSGIAVITKRNGSGATVRGVNLEASYAAAGSLVIQSGATVQQAFYDKPEILWQPQTGDEEPATTTLRILRTPTAYGYLTLSYKPTRKWTLSASAVYTGTMQAPHLADTGNQRFIIEDTPAFIELNLKPVYRIKLEKWGTIELSSGIFNLFNSYQKDFDTGPLRDAGYIYGPARPRTVFVGLKYQFN